MLESKISVNHTSQDGFTDCQPLLGDVKRGDTHRSVNDCRIEMSAGTDPVRPAPVTTLHRDRNTPESQSDRAHRHGVISGTAVVRRIKPASHDWVAMMAECELNEISK
jgi:hypothetical protein